MCGRLMKESGAVHSSASNAEVVLEQSEVGSVSNPDVVQVSYRGGGAEDVLEGCEVRAVHHVVVRRIRISCPHQTHLRLRYAPRCQSSRTRSSQVLWSFHPPVVAARGKVCGD